MTTATPDGLTAEEFAFIATWAAMRGLAVEINGNCGFGRDCVGLINGSNYVDYNYDDGIWTPPDAYHKHDCLAVLGHGPGPLRQLYEWVKWLDANGWTVETVDRDPENYLDLLLHGTTTTRIVRAT